MKALAVVLQVKIAVTVLFWCLPLLTLPPSWFSRIGVPVPHPALFVRLLGAAYLALVVGYTLGLRELRQGKDARSVVWMGIVSNGSAFAILFLFGITGTWAQWGNLAQVLMWGSVIMTALITLGLLITGVASGVVPLRLNRAKPNDRSGL